MQSLSTTSANLQPNNWYHIAAVYSYPGTAKIYINGVENASKSTSEALTTNNGNLRFGQNNALAYPFNGTIDEVAIYSRAKSADEIAADVNPLYVSLDVRDLLNNQVSVRGATEGYINPGGNNTFYLKTSENGNLNMTAGAYSGLYSLRIYANNLRTNLLLKTVQEGVSSIQALLPVQ